MLYEILKAFLFRLPAETAHSFTMWVFRIITRIPILNLMVKRYFVPLMPELKVNLFGLEFPNQVGLAAGFDKNGHYYRSLSYLGFGHVELGTVTPVAQPGNPAPRLFRLVKDDALINRMGFNNLGAAALAKRLLRKRPKGLIVGGNIGKNKNTPNELASEDYLACFETLFPVVDYLAVNISSPNTPGLRALQDKVPLLELLNKLQALNQSKPNPKPLLLKIAPDLTQEQLDDIIDIVRIAQFSGIIATNTTTDRTGLQTDPLEVEALGAGGLSGAPLADRSTEVISYLYKKTHGKLPIIGVGGIASPQDAIAKLNAGASLLQIYSGMVFYGPHLVKDINKALQELHHDHK